MSSFNRGPSRFSTPYEGKPPQFTSPEQKKLELREKITGALYKLETGKVDPVLIEAIKDLLQLSKIQDKEIADATELGEKAYARSRN